MKTRFRQWLLGSLAWILHALGTEIAKYHGTVIEVGVPTDDGAVIELAKPGEEPIRRVFPCKRLAATQAAFPTALVEYAMFDLGAVSLSILRYVGPSREELLNQPLDTLSEEEIRALEAE